MSRAVTRAAALLVGITLCLLGSALSAGAAGTGDVELVPAGRDGEPQTSFRVSASDDAISFELVNLADEPRSVRLYPASAERGAGGGIGIGSEGSAPWLDLPDEQITLGPRESRSFQAAVKGRELPERREQLGAVVLEAPQGAITVRVATLVTIEGRPAIPLPLWLVALALIALALAAFGFWVARRRVREDGQVNPGPEEVQHPALVG